MKFGNLLGKKKGQLCSDSADYGWHVWIDGEVYGLLDKECREPDLSEIHEGLMAVVEFHRLSTGRLVALFVELV